MSQILRENAFFSSYNWWLFNLCKFSERALKIFTKERFGILLFSQSYKTLAVNTKEISHAAARLFLWKPTCSKRFTYETKFISICNLKKMYISTKHSISRMRVVRRTHRPFICYSMTTGTPKTFPDRQYILQSKNRFGIRERPAAPKVSKYIHTFERGDIQHNWKVWAFYLSPKTHRLNALKRFKIYARRFHDKQERTLDK